MKDLPGIAQFRLDGRTAIITGGSKGLGLSMAAGLASAGARVMLVSRHGGEAIAAADELARGRARHEQLQRRAVLEMQDLVRSHHVPPAELRRFEQVVDGRQRRAWSARRGA